MLTIYPFALLDRVKLRHSAKFLVALECRNGPSKTDGPFLHLIDGDLSTVTDDEIQKAMDRLNNRPRKCLGYRTPNEVFFGKSAVALAS